MPHRDRKDHYSGAISFGAFLILIAIFYLISPNLLGEVRAFIHDLKPVPISQNFWLLEPSQNHPVLYSAAQEFSYFFGLVQIIILALEFAGKDSVREKARTFSNVIFWAGVGYSFGMLSGGAIAWIPFLGALIVFTGVSIVVRSIVLAVASRSKLSHSS